MHLRATRLPHRLPRALLRSHSVLRFLRPKSDKADRRNDQFPAQAANKEGPQLLSSIKPVCSKAQHKRMDVPPHVCIP